VHGIDLRGIDDFLEVNEALFDIKPVADMRETWCVLFADRHRRDVGMIEIDGHELRSEAKPHHRNAQFPGRVHASIADDLPGGVKAK
jgi:hypothetical protein